MAESRELGVVKRWTDKGFGFIERESGGNDVFCHARDLQGIKALVPGSKVSFVFQEDEKTGKAKEVQVEEAVEEVEQIREASLMGIVKRWNAEKGFGFIGRSAGEDCFVHKRECAGNDLTVGQAVSFVYEETEKGGNAKKVQEEEGGEPVIEEDEGERELGKVKSYNEEKGFAFIARCVGGDDIFAHKREFGGLDPWVGQPVSFIVESTEKGDAAKKVRDEESVPDFVVARFFEKQCNGMVPEKQMCVSFILEEGEKGPSAKDVREEDPDRVARVTAKVHYGTVAQYFDPTEKRPTNGYGFIERLGDKTRFYFHMSEIVEPDEEGGIDIDTGVSFIIIPARKGLQAASVTIADPPVVEKTPEPETPLAIEDSFAALDVGKDVEADPDAPVDLEDPDAW
ncbi:MAG: hypothetical protein Q9195_007282 [Heterodermia aff. obscurata]